LAIGYAGELLRRRDPSRRRGTRPRL